MTTNNQETLLNFQTVNSDRIYYRSSGKGDPVLLLHGWPTSSFLWRKIIPMLSVNHRVIAPDLAGFGLSEKSVSQTYSLEYHCGILNCFLQLLNINKVSLVLHDLGGPIGLLWAVRNPQKLNRLIITDTIISPDHSGLSFSMKILMSVARIPVFRSLLVSNYAIGKIIELGTSNHENLSNDVLSEYQVPYISKEAKRVLLKTLTDPIISEFKEIYEKLPDLNTPTAIVFGEDDVWLKGEFDLLKQILPGAEFSIIQEANHFLQEDKPEELSKIILNFLN